MQIGVIGAGGFVGSRLMEEAVLRGHQGWVAIVRSPRSVARLSRVQCPYRIVDTGRVERLAAVLHGFDAVVNVSLGDSHRMLAETKAIYESCQQAGVPLLIHLSSAVVFDRAKLNPGQSEPDCVEGHWMLYARAKLACEKYLKDCFSRSASPRVVVLRPSLIWGPRSPWSLYPVKALDRGIAWLGKDGTGVCNLIYLDNLNRCIRQVVEKGPSISGFYNVRDPDPIRWADYFSAIARHLGYPLERIRTVETTEAPWSKAALAEWLKQRLWFYAGSKWLLARMDGNTKSTVKKILPWLAGGGIEPPLPVDAPLPKSKPCFTREIIGLHSTENRLSMEPFICDFGDPGLLSFDEALRRTVGWMRFAGYGKDEAL